MDSATAYGRMSVSRLIEELEGITLTLSSRMRELGSLTQDYNNDFYPTYFRTPGNSVAAKEREANYQCLQHLNEIALVEADIRALTTLRDLLLTMLPYATE